MIGGVEEGGDAVEKATELGLGLLARSSLDVMNSRCYEQQML